MHIIHLIRWKNLLLIGLTQILIKYVLFDPAFGASITLNGFGFSLLVISTLSIAAAGYIINDIYDVETDTINHPNSVIVGRLITEKTAYNLYIILTVVGVALGFYLSNLIGRSGFAALFVIISALLYIYASYLKRIAIVGNLVISILVAMSIIIVGIFELLPAITQYNQPTQATFFELLRDYAIFAFMINFLREMVKDIEDIDGDYKAGMQTLPIIMGRERTGKVVFILSFIPIAAIIYYVITFLYRQQLAIGYFLVFVVGPLLYFSVKSYSAETKDEWQRLSKILKLVMLFGVFSMILYKFILIK